MTSEYPQTLKNPIAVQYIEQMKGSENSRYEISGNIFGAEKLLIADSIQILLGTNNAPPLSLQSATLNFPSYSCEFKANGQRVYDNQYLALARTGRCGNGGGQSAMSPFLLVMEFADSIPALAVWSSSADDQIGLQIHDHQERKHFARIRTTKNEIEPRSRLDLLMYMWQEASPAAASVLILGSLALFGSLIFAVSGANRVSNRCFNIVFPTLIFAGASLFYSGFMPPFHGPDEPDHFLSFGTISSDEAFARKALELAAIGHFRAIKQKDGIFTSKQLNEKLEGPWIESWEEKVEDSRMQARSPLTHTIWRFFSPLLENRPVAQQVLGLRVLNALVTSISWAVLAASLTFFSGQSAIGVLPLLLAPALPFFCMHISNYPFLAAGHFLFCAGIVLLHKAAQTQKTQDRQISFVFIVGSILTGIGIVVAIQGAKIGLALLLPAALLIADLFNKSFLTQANLGLFRRNGLRLLLRPVVAYLLLVVALTPLFLASGPWVTDLQGYFAKFSEKFFDGKVVDFRVTNPAWLIIMMFSFATVLLTVVFGLLGEAFKGFKDKQLPPWGLCGLRISLVALFFVGTWRSNWNLPDIESKIDFGLDRYVYLALRTFIKDMGFASPDFYITSSFWAGFGWLDVPMPGWIVGSVSAFPLAFLAWFLFKIEKLTVNQAATGIIRTTALVTYLCGLAYLAFSYPVNLHGRYMIGFYILYLFQIGIVLVALCSRCKAQFPGVLVLMGSLVAIALHGYSAYCIATRYFG